MHPSPPKTATADSDWKIFRVVDLDLSSVSTLLDSDLDSRQ